MKTAKTATSLSEELLKLPVQPSTAMRVLMAIDDDDTSAAELARIVEVDPALSCRLIQLANAPLYGLRHRVTSAAHAMMVVGFGLVRAVAVATSAGLFIHHRKSVPDGFWAHATAAAVGAAVVAEHTDADISDAFSAGLLHDLGTGLLYRFADEQYYEILCACADTGTPLVDLEAQQLGITHPAAAAMALEGWRFAPEVVSAIAHHHDPYPAPDALSAAVLAGDALAVTRHPEHAHGREHPPAEAIGWAGVDPGLCADLIERLDSELEGLSSLLSW